MTLPSSHETELRAETGSPVLVFAPIGRDAALTRELLGRESIACAVCASIDELCAHLGTGGALILTEEVFDAPGFDRLALCLRQQPPWSDIPILMFAGTEAMTTSLQTVDLLETLPNVTLLDRPIRLAIAISIVRAALRARARQFEVRDLLVELQASREQAEAANRLKDEFLATVSHELRTPLNAILGWTTMLRLGEVEPARVSKALQVIDRNARAQVQLVEDILDMARIITGKLRVDLKTVSLPASIDAAVEAVRPAADAKSIRLIVGAPPRVGEVRGDGDRLQQVFWNLLSNAVRFTPEGGSVRVRFDVTESAVGVSVIDSGAGLDPAFLPYVFDRFRQADQSVTRGHGGLGIGLAIVKHLVELHGGRVEALSEGIGKGSTFRVNLPIPLLLEPAAGRSQSPDDDAFAIRLAGRCVLVVDDDTATVELLEELFARVDATVTTAASSAAAFDVVQRTPPDVVIADIGLPLEDGCALMRRIRQLPAPAGRVPAIALSAYTRAEDRASARASGFTEFIGKPADPQDLLRAVDRLLS